MMNFELRHRIGYRAVAGTVGLLAIIALAGTSARAGEKVNTASLVVGPIKGIDNKGIPGVLSERDVSRYRVIFQLQEEGDWKEADKIIAQLDDKMLMGHVLAQRYLHPTKYRSRYVELKKWLDKYHDHPQARRIYKLALKRRPKNYKRPHRPSRVYLFGSGHDNSDSQSATLPAPKRLSRGDARKRRQLDRQFARYLRKGWTKSAKTMLHDKNFKRLHGAYAYDRAQGLLAMAYFTDGRDQWAIDWGTRATKRSGKYLPEAHWAVGLAAWRLNRFDLAREEFGAVATSEYASPWLLTAGALWAARASLRAGKPEDFNRWLNIASAYPRTFYGLLARRILGIKVTFNWASPPLALDALTALTAHPGGRRAFNLLQAGEDELAERELRNLYDGATTEVAQAMLALADRANMPALAMRLGNLLADSGSSMYDSTAFPVPELEMASRTAVDLPLILAFVRQESGFNPRAKSHAGARGLMQLMPRTASFVAHDRRYRNSHRNELYDPETNIEIGYKYIDILRNDDSTGGDLFKMVTAWNAGPGNVGKWQRSIKDNGDPLLFIESIPLRETRIFVEHVMTNLWIYRARFNQPTPSLDAVASGEWPQYHVLTVGPQEVADNGRQN